jgi:hypothetical protein
MAVVEEPRWTQQCPVLAGGVDDSDRNLDEQTGGCRRRLAWRKRTRRREREVVVWNEKEIREERDFLYDGKRMAFLL